MLNKYERLLTKIKKAEIVCAVLMFGFIVAVIAAQVFVRYVFGKPFPWAEELSSLLLIYLTFLTADIVYKDKAHISVDFFVNFLSQRYRAALALGLWIFIMIFLIVLMPTCVRLLKMQWGHITAAVLILPKSFWSLPVPIAFASMILTTFYFILLEFKTLLNR